MNIRARQFAAALALAALSATAGCGQSESFDVDPVEVDARPLGVEDPADLSGVTVPEDSGDPGGECDALASFTPSDDTDSPEVQEILDRGTLRVGVDQTTYLMGYRDPQTGQLDGFDIRIAREIAADLLGSPDAIEFTVLTSQERIPAVVDGEVDLVVRTMTITCERREQVDFSAEYYRSGQKVLVPEWFPDELAAVEGEKLCSSPGSTSLARVKEVLKAEPVSARRWADCMILLQQGHVAGMTTDDSILAGMAQQDPGTKVIGDAVSVEPYGIAVHKDNPALTAYVNHVLERLRSDGGWQEIYGATLEPVLGAAEPPEPQYVD